MNILIINFPLRSGMSQRFFSLGLGYIATAIKNAGFAFDLIDLDVNRNQGLKFAKSYDVVCMGSLISGYKKIKHILLEVRKFNPHAKIIVGNSVATSIPNLLLNNTEADIVVMSEGDETIVDLLNTIKHEKSIDDVRGICYKHNGRIVYTEQRKAIKNISLIPNVDFDIFDIEGYIKNSDVDESDELIGKDIRPLAINTARGCPFNCTFCYHTFKSIKYRRRSPQSIVSEIKNLIKKYGINYVKFYDELTFFTKKQANDFAEEVLSSGLNIYWVAQCRANLFNAQDIDIVKKMKDAGCCGMGYSLESSDASILCAMNKKISVKHFSEQSKLLQDAGISTWTSLVLGYPQETPETIRKTFECCTRSNIYPSIGFLLPQPASVMYEYAIEHGFIQNEEEYILKMGDRQDLTVNMTQMSNDEFESIIAEEAQKCNEALRMGLEKDKLIKTSFYRITK